MKTALVISSFVAASRVGATASAFCLRRLGVETHILPTTLLGRHPGWGPPGGGPAPISLMQDMWEGIRAQNISYDAVMTGYMASEQHAHLASQIITYVKTQNPSAFILVDPVMGDNGHLYVPKNTAEAIIETLCPAANIVTPNAWELEYITKQPTKTLPQVLSALQKLPASSLITSVPLGADIGAVLYNDKIAHLTRHKKFSDVPHGGGDALAAAFLAHFLMSNEASTAFEKSVTAVFNILSYAVENGLYELPLTDCQDALYGLPSLPVERLSFD